MQVNNNNSINSMIQLEKRLEESADALSKLSSTNEESSQKNKKEMTSNENKENSFEQVDLVEEMVHQIEIPLAYNANAEVISTQDSVTRTLLDIKA